MDFNQRLSEALDSGLSSPTKEMKDWFQKRTKLHIDLVQKYCRKIHKYDAERFPKIIERGKAHDQSKLEDPELEPYIFVTWKHKCKDDDKKFDPPKDLSDRMNKATEHHITSNSHHPEFHCDKEDLEKSSGRDATKMSDEDIAEMVADWCAMSEEKGNTPKSWADQNVNKKWIFTDDQTDLIYELIDAIWDE